jgi:hypothetical protein
VLDEKAGRFLELILAEFKPGVVLEVLVISSPEQEVQIGSALF